MSAEYNEAAYAAQHAAEGAQDSLWRRFEALAALVPADVAELAGVKSLLEGVKWDIGKQCDATDYMISYIPREFRRPEPAAPLARRVFGTPELLEKIVLVSQTRTVFDSMRVSKDFFNTIEGSLKLQRKVGLMADPEAHISFKAKVFFDDASGLNFEMHSEPHIDTDYGAVVKLELNVTACQDVVANPGARLRSVLLTQPPIKHLDVSVSCCGSGSPYTSCRTLLTMSVQNETGVTVGEVRDKVLQLREAHRLCPHASLEHHDGEDGTVEPSVRFTGDFMLVEDDYSVLNDKRMEAERQREDEERDAFVARIGPYVGAKRAGKSAVAGPRLLMR